MFIRTRSSMSRMLNRLRRSPGSGNPREHVRAEHHEAVGQIAADESGPPVIMTGGFGRSLVRHAPSPAAPAGAGAWAGAAR